MCMYVSYMRYGKGDIWYVSYMRYGKGVICYVFVVLTSRGKCTSPCWSQC